MQNTIEGEFHGEKNMLERKRYCRGYMVGGLTALAVFGMIYLGYFCPDKVCALSSGSPTPAYKTDRDNPDSHSIQGYVRHRDFEPQDFEESTLDRDYDFDVKGEDVLVFLHIQKTGGTTFGRHLVKNLDIDTPCKCSRGRKRCDCSGARHGHIWLFSRFSTGWSCGLHADWQQDTHTSCLLLPQQTGDRIHLSSSLLISLVFAESSVSYLTDNLQGFQWDFYSQNNAIFYSEFYSNFMQHF